MKLIHQKLNQEKESPTGKANTTVFSELGDYLETHQLRRHIFPRAALVGALAGGVALLFRAGLTGADTLRNSLILFGKAHPAWGWILPLLLASLGAVVSVALVRRYAPEAAGSGIPHLESVLRRFRRVKWKKLLPVKFCAGLIAIGSGLALGREGPTVQMGGAVGDAVAGWLKVPPRERLTLTSAGAGAGLAAAFNAPLSGLIFVLEEMRRDFQPIVFGAVFVAAVIADIIARIGQGQFPVFSVPSYPMPPLGSIPLFVLLGLLAGLLGVLFNRGLLLSIRLYASLPRRFILPAAALTGALVGLGGWFSPSLLGSGHTLAETVLNGDVLLTVIPVFFLARYLMTISSYGAGAAGGIFAPLLVLGALIGLAVGEGAHALWPAVVPTPAVFAVVGMAAYFTAIVRAPLTGIMLIVEMTGSYNQMLPLLVACFSAYAITEFLKDVPIYEALLERDLKRSGSKLLLEKPTVMEFLIHTSSPFDGREIRSLGLPAGCILVRCMDGAREWVPKANTRLHAHMRITAVVAPEAAEGIALLQRGCETSPRRERKASREAKEISRKELESKSGKKPDKKPD